MIGPERKRKLRTRLFVLAGVSFVFPALLLFADAPAPIRPTVTPEPQPFDIDTEADKACATDPSAWEATVEPPPTTNTFVIPEVIRIIRQDKGFGVPLGFRNAQILSDKDNVQAIMIINPYNPKRQWLAIVDRNIQPWRISFTRDCFRVS